MQPIDFKYNINVQVLHDNEEHQILDTIDNSIKDDVLRELKDLEIVQLYMNDLIGIDIAYDTIMEKSRNCGLDPLTFCKLISEHLKGNFEEKQLVKVEELTQQIQNTIEGEQLFHELAKKITHNSGEISFLANCYEFSKKIAYKIEDKSSDIEEFFKQHVDKLKLFISSKHKELLALSGDQTTEKQEEFRLIKRTFRDFFIGLAKNQQKNPYFKGQLWSPLAFFNINYSTFDRNKLDEMHDFMDELMNFRKNYLCRYSMHKVKQAIEDKSLQILKEIKDDKISISDQCLSLLKLTFLHGTNSAILQNLPYCDMKLIPVGHLIHKGIVPLSGELREGAVLNKSTIKESEISATTLDDGLRALDEYASNSIFYFNIDLEKSFLEKFLKISKDKNYFDSISSTHDVIYWARYSIAILRIRLMDKKFFNEIKEDLFERIENLQTSFNLLKKTSDYKNHMPKSLDPDGSLGYKYHDKYYYNGFRKAEMNLDSLTEALNKPLITVEKGNNDSSPFPIVFGSTNTHTKGCGREDNLERRTQKFCLLGKDIQFLFVDSKDEKTLYEYLQKHDLENQVTIVDHETLRQSIRLNKLASDYFDDFASRKKLAQIDEQPLLENLWNTGMLFADAMGPMKVSLDY